MKRIALLGLIVPVLAATACSSREALSQESVRWSSTAPIASPVATAQAPAGYGWIEVRDRDVHQVQGYSVYDARGRVVLSSDQRGSDRRLLPAGRFIALGVIDLGLFDEREKRIQFVVEPGYTTVLDFAAVPARPLESAEPPSSGHSR